ncbi:MAG TPA: protein kinase [Candidatus Acidoferrales bacterium]|nr:protein kinase [Candidatus Acidoferrales bacterium]
MGKRSIILFFVSAVRNLLSILLWVVVAGFLVLFGLEFYRSPGTEAFRLVVVIRQWGDPIVHQTKRWLNPPPSLSPFVPFALGLAVWGTQALLHAFMRQVHYRLALALPVKEPVKETHAVPTGGVALAAPPDSEKAREELLKRYREIEQALKSAKRKGCTFLSVDIVGSTKMKAGAGDTSVTISFHAYEDMLKKIFREYGAWKQAWTPDGVMVCFLQRELAVGSAQRILQGLDEFNAKYNRLRTPFQVRCGINEGEVRIYEDTNLERVADRVIDVAGHMQKEGRPNTLWLSAEVYAQLADKSGFHLVNKKVDGYEVYQWALEPVEAEAEGVAAAKPPAVPAVPTLEVTLAGAPTEAGKVTRIRRYEILEELGRGAMGAVYKARDPQIGRTVAIKVILTTGLSPEGIDEYKQRFTREAQVAGQMTHPGIVTIHDIGEDEAGQPFLVMEFLEGTPLEKMPVPLENPVDIGLQLAEALDFAHRRGVIHRDLKPANIMISADGRAKILDFGIAQLAGSQLTQVGQLLGTPAFMSPEQFSGAKVDARSDLFSLGTVIYWMCTGKNPFMGKSLAAVALKVMQITPTAAHQLNPALAPDIDTILARCMAKDSAERYPSGAALAADLKALQAGRALHTA